MTVETDDDDVRRALTPACPSIDRRFEAMQRARQRGIAVQVAVSPTLPYLADRFVDRLAGVADRVVVDTFFGDGAEGNRTARRPLPAFFRQAGYGDWRDTAAAEELYARLQSRLGVERVGWSREGFNALAMGCDTDDARDTDGADAEPRRSATRVSDAVPRGATLRL